MIFRRAIFLSFLAALAQAAQPDFSGDWKLDLSRSNFGKFPAPLSVTRKVTHQGVKLSMTVTQRAAQGEVSNDWTYSTDGKSVTNKVQGGESKGSAQWIGDKLMIESSREVQGVTLTQKDIWTLAADGKTLTIDSHVTLPNGEFDIKQVFARQ